MFKKNKRGLDKLYVGLIIGLALLIVLLSFTYRLNKTYTETEQKRLCKEAIGVSAATKIKGDDSIMKLFSSPLKEESSDVPCPVIYTDLSGSNAERTKKELATMMYDSWDMMGEGKLDLFSGIVGNRTYCVLTHHIKFDKKGQKIEGFTDYLVKEKIPDGRTYAEYLKCFNNDITLTDLAKKNTGVMTIDTDNDYGIMFVYAKKGYLHKVWSAWEYGKAGFVSGVASAGIFMIMPDVIVSKGMAFVIITTDTAAGATYGYLTGAEKAADWQACVMLFPYSEEYLKSLKCDYMPADQGKRS